MKKDWLRHSLSLACEPADLIVGGRKILRRRVITFDEVADDLTLKDAGYSGGGSKISLLLKNYLNAESHAAAVALWKRRCEMGKYGSVSFTTFNHFVKGAHVKNGEIPDDAGIGSVFGPCIQSVAITWLNRRETAVDVFYRSTEWLKKFPADLVLLRDHLLPTFELDNFTLTFYFANITMHSMYFIGVIPSLEDPISVLEQIKTNDPRFHSSVVRWLRYYLVDDTGISKFAQAVRVQKDANNRIDDTRPLLRYLKRQK